MKGITLLEVLVAMGIATIVGVLLVVIITNSAGLFKDQSSKVSVGVNTNDSFSQIRASIKQASAISDQSGSGQLILKVASIDAGGNIIDSTYDDFVFLINQKNLHFQIIPNLSSSRKSKDSILAGNVDNINFQYLNFVNPPAEVTPAAATKIRISLNIKSSIATAEANLRND
ncbi:MAG: hypothetical protein Q7R77_04530 [Candidatus Daviesbacteria bacterium]|nr:hypothetical protein [Candidatus Daviesbacteria bacterium]